MICSVLNKYNIEYKAAISPLCITLWKQGIEERRGGDPKQLATYCTEYNFTNAKEGESHDMEPLLA